jgi:hypothetical protein
MTQDKYGKTLKVGDWVYYPWLNRHIIAYDYLCGKIRRIKENGDIYVHPSGEVSTARLAIKMPRTKNKREQKLLLWKLEQ